LIPFRIRIAEDSVRPIFFQPPLAKDYRASFARNATIPTSFVTLSDEPQRGQAPKINAMPWYPSADSAHGRVFWLIQQSRSHSTNKAATIWP